MGYNEEIVINWVLNYITENGFVFDKEQASEKLEDFLRKKWVCIRGFGD